jgi:hypothetical protein
VADPTDQDTPSYAEVHSGELAEEAATATEARRRRDRERLRRNREKIDERAVKARQQEAESGVFGANDASSTGNQKGPISRSPSPEIREWLQDLPPEERHRVAGSGGTHIDVPNFIACESEDVMQNGNAWIVLGGDRPGNIGTGAGSADSHSYAIDLVAGRMGSRASKKDKNNDVIYVNPSFTLDAARVYISQKSDIDHYLKLNPKICTTDYKRPASCVALKADVIRVVSRQDIKLVTCTDRENAQGGDVGINYGIHLISQNDPENLQSMVLGENLVDTLQKLYTQVKNNREILHTFLLHQKDFNRELLHHSHFGPVIGWTSLSPTAAKAGIENMVKLITQAETQIYGQMMADETKQIDALIDGGAKSILSPLNKTN